MFYGFRGCTYRTCISQSVHYEFGLNFDNLAVYTINHLLERKKDANLLDFSLVCVYTNCNHDGESGSVGASCGGVVLCRSVMYLLRRCENVSTFCTNTSEGKT
ncbi:hypothetical protein DVH24_005993 [Malus domestica]|uniref:Uncharacterized protein n=1 Tax=Malus domestica TaxID=3750 RepID=A0A498IKN1_MALDO|nr:hypothetical protein DVH24_005993 [Malus domestica]